MHCEELKELAPLFIVDLLDEAEESTVRSHLDAGCPSCASELAAAHQTLDLLPLALPIEVPAPMAKSKVLASVRTEESAKFAKKTRSDAPAPSPATNWIAVIMAGIAGAVAGALVAGMIASRGAAAQMATMQAEMASQESRLLAQADELATTKQQLTRATAAFRLVRSPMVRIFDLTMQGQTRSGYARVLWDRSNSFWQVYAEDLPTLEPGRVFQLWFITPTEKRSAGVLSVSPAGEVEHRVAVPANIGLIVAGTITDEPEGGSLQPTGRIWFLGEVK